MKTPNRKKVLHSETVHVICDAVEVENFSRDRDGNDIPSGIKLKIPTRIREIVQ